MFSKQKTNTPYSVSSSVSSQQQSANSLTFSSSPVYSAPVRSLNDSSDIIFSLVDEILKSKKFKFKSQEDSQAIVRNVLKRLWVETVELLALSQSGKAAAVYFHHTISKTMVEAGKACRQKNLSFSDVYFITGEAISGKPLFAQSFAGLADEPIELTATIPTVYMPIKYHSAKEPLSGKMLAKAVNYFVGERKWNISIYFEKDDGSPDNIKKMHAWFERNYHMLNQLSKKYNTELIPQRDTGILTQDAISNAEAFFQERLATDERLLHALKSDIHKGLSLYLKPKEKRSESDSVKDLYRYYAELLDTISRDPKTTSEETVKLLFFWHKVCHPESRVSYSQFSLFNKSETQLAPSISVVDEDNRTTYSSRNRMTKIAAQG